MTDVNVTELLARDARRAVLRHLARGVRLRRPDGLEASMTTPATQEAAQAADIAAQSSSPREATDDGAWEWEYAVDDDPEGSVYGHFRRLVGPWERDPLPDTNEGETR